MNDRFNTIAGWVLGGGIVLLGATLVTGEIFKHHPLEQKGYPIEGVEEEGGSGGAAEEPPIAALLATADATRGEAAFRKCSTCHTIADGGANGIGPNLYRTMGSPLGHIPSFAYSDALKSIGGNWGWENMNDWLRNPRAFANGTKMTFAGISSPQERADLILYMNAQGSNLPLPAAPAADAPAADGAPPAEGTSANASGNAAAPATAGNSAAGDGLKGGGDAEPNSVNPGGR